MSLFDELSEKALGDAYFKQLFCKAEAIAASDFFKITKNLLDEKEFLDLLRFADILSRSKEYDAQNKAY